MLDEEMEELNLQKRSFTKWDSDSEDEITDADVRKIIIVVQVAAFSKCPGTIACLNKKKDQICCYTRCMVSRRVTSC